MSTRRGQWIVLLASMLGGFCHADTIYLSDGTEIEGTIIEEKGGNVVIRNTSGTLQSVRKSSVEAIVREPKAPPPPAPVVVKPAEPAPAAAAPAASPAKPAEGAAAEAAPAKPADPAKPAEGTTDAAKPEPAKEPETAAKPAEEEASKKDDWTPPPGLPGFPDHAERMSKEKEAQFMDALNRMATTVEAQRVAAKNEVAAMGAPALPYVVAGIQHINVEARSTCMYLVGQLNGRTAVKQVIEVFYSAMPATGEAATYQVPFIRAIKTTLPMITGQSFINVQPDKSLVQDGLKQYIAWYNDNFDRLPAQLGEPKIEPTDPEYDKKLAEARKLKLEKRSWPRPPLPADIVEGGDKRNQPTAKDLIGRGGRNYGDTVPKVSRDDALRRR